MTSMDFALLSETANHVQRAIDRAHWLITDTGLLPLPDADRVAIADALAMLALARDTLPRVVDALEEEEIRLREAAP